MSDYPILEEMGVINPKEITRYTLRPEGHIDVLTIYYRRKKGSFLPSSRKYKIGRAAKTVRVDSGKQEFEETYTISPFLQKAIAEIDKIVKHSEVETNRIKILLSEVNHLEKTMVNQISELRKQIKALE